ncbi:DUF6382 domain-containing protein [Paenibacillus planticolens]|uniref:DUF6382 domain-containing protein n=1 Tax=Paenibacillus planticolens TaxID=2654976 RepID=UPI001491DB4A|nr:DUF6382 domain-containing protein [Paenibacillus planticolens]
MTEEVFGLRYEFVYRHGHYMRLCKDDSDGLKAEDFSTLQVKMLEANTIPKLLPLEIQEVDLRISLLYRLAAKRMLVQVLKIEGFSRWDFARLLYAIVCALEDSKNYMLLETGFVLRENFIFIGSDWSDVFLTYVPMESCSTGGDVMTSLKSLASQIALKIDANEKEELESWLDLMLRHQSLRDFKQCLRNLMDEKKPAMQEELPKPIWQQNTLNKPAKISIPSGEILGNKPTMDVGGANTGQAVSFTPLSQRLQIFVLAGVSVAASFLWRHYISLPSASTLHLTAGMTILLADIWFVSKFLGMPRYKREQNKPQLPIENNNAMSKLENEPGDIQTHYQNLHLHTTLIPKKGHNATVILGNLRNTLQGPRLEIQIQDSPRLVAIVSDHFTIGRGDANLKVDYVLEEAGVSRVHAEITKSEQGYELKDSGSTNGTCLNGEELVAYQSYLLKDGDEIRIVRQEMIFRC